MVDITYIDQLFKEIGDSNEKYKNRKYKHKAGVLYNNKLKQMYQKDKLKKRLQLKLKQRNRVSNNNIL